MKLLFADTFYFIALLSPADTAHSKAVAFTQQFSGRLLTTAWILAEIADGLLDAVSKERFLQFYDQLCIRDDVTIVPCSEDVFEQGIDLYRRRLDKEWSLTDCISFVIMQRENVSEALTEDHHFEQAGFTALLR